MSGALAYLAQHMESACPRSAYLAALLLNRIADDTGNDAHLRHMRSFWPTSSRVEIKHDPPLIAP